MTETYTFDDILIKPKAYSSVKSRTEVDVSSKLYSYLNFSLPAISASMSLFDTESENSRSIVYSFANAMAEAGSLHIFSRSTTFTDRLKAVKSLSTLGIQCGIAVSLTEFELYKEELMSLPEKAVVSIDIANGAIIRDIQWGGDYITPLPTLIVGNFGNPGAVLRRDLLGQIAFKVGIGSGSGCTTRVTTGVGAPQAWLIDETKSLSRKPVISDGGVKSVADFVKAVALGSDLVMMGKIFAAAKETPWREVKHDGKWYKPYRGMASSEEKGVQSYIEGDSGFIPYEGKTIVDIMTELKDGLTSAMSYSDSHDLEEFWQKKEFLRVTPSTVIENGARLYHF